MSQQSPTKREPCAVVPTTSKNSSPLWICETECSSHHLPRVSVEGPLFSKSSPWALSQMDMWNKCHESVKQSIWRGRWGLFMVMLNAPRQMNNPSVLLAQPPSDSTVTPCQIFLLFSPLTASLLLEANKAGKRQRNGLWCVILTLLFLLWYTFLRNGSFSSLPPSFSTLFLLFICTLAYFFVYIDLFLSELKNGADGLIWCVRTPASTSVFEFRYSSPCSVICVCVCVSSVHFCQITLKGITRTTFVIYPEEAVFSFCLKATAQKKRKWLLWMSLKWIPFYFNSFFQFFLEHSQSWGALSIVECFSCLR